MASFAKIGLNSKVILVLSVHNNVLKDSNGVEQESIGIEFLKNLYNEPNAVWKQTSYNTSGNIHYGIDGKPDNKTPLRANFASIEHTYDQDNDVFYAPQPFNSWILNKSTWIWEAPVVKPTTGGPYTWDETIKNWVEKQ